MDTGRCLTFSDSRLMHISGGSNFMSVRAAFSHHLVLIMRKQNGQCRHQCMSAGATLATIRVTWRILQTNLVVLLAEVTPERFCRARRHQHQRLEGHMMHRIPIGQESPIRSTFHRDAISRIDRSPVPSVSRPITKLFRHTMSSSDSSLASSFFSSAFSSAGAAPPAAAAGAEPPPPPPDGTEASFWDPSEMSCGSVTTQTTQIPGLVTRD
jgi:hypothetical protein